jgi:hypothetical protein
MWQQVNQPTIALETKQKSLRKSASTSGFDCQLNPEDCEDSVSNRNRRIHQSLGTIPKQGKRAKVDSRVVCFIAKLSVSFKLTSPGGNVLTVSDGI